MSIYGTRDHAFVDADVQEKQDALRLNWLRLMEQFIRIMRHSTHVDGTRESVEFTAEDLETVAFNTRDIPRPADSRWLGSLFQRAKRDGLIRQVQSDYIGEPVTVLTKSRHRSPLWVAA